MSEVDVDNSAYDPSTKDEPSSVTGSLPVDAVTLLELSHDAILILDANATILYWNQGAQVIYGYKREEAVGRISHDLLRTDSSVPVEERVATAKREGSWEGELRHRTKSGSAVVVSSRWTIRQNANGEIERIMETNRDVTEERRAQDEVKRRAEELQAVLDSVPAAVFIQHDPDGRNITGNPGSYEILRMTPGTNESKTAPNAPNHFRIFKDGRELSGDELPMQAAAIRNEPIRDFEEDLVFDDGTAVALFGTAIPLRNPDGTVRGSVGAFVDVTRLEAAERRFQSLFENAAVGIVEGTAQGVITAANPRACEIFGYSQEELIGRSTFDITHPDDHQATRDLLQAFSEGIRSGVLEKRYLRKDGSFIWSRTSLSTVTNHQGMPIRLMAIIEQINSQKEAEASLRESEEKFRRFFESAAVGAVQADPLTGRFLEVNDRFCRFTGYSRNELLSRCFYDLTHPDDLEASREGLARLNTGLIEEHVQEKRYVRKDGAVVWATLSISLVRDPAGKPLHTVAIINDMTERRAAEQALREREELLRMAAEMGSIGTYHTDLAKGTVTHAPLGQRLTGIPRPTVSLTEIYARIHPDDRAMVAAAVERSKNYETSEPYAISYRFVWDDGSVHWVRSRGGFQFDESKDPPVPYRSVGVIMDITDNVERESSLEKMVLDRTRELRISNEELQTFTYAVAHDLRAPMRSIIATSCILLEEVGPKLEEDHILLLKRQVDNATKLGHLLDDLLRLSRVGQVQLSPQTVDLTKVASEVVASHRDSPCEVWVQPGMLTMADPSLLRVILENLIGNAIKYSPKGGDVRVGSKTEGGDVVIFVSDQGIGFDMEYAEKIFHPFERLHRDDEIPGTGIGLANVRRAVERHGGKVWAKSEPDKGSTFYFTLS